MVDFTGDDILIYIIYMDDFPSYKKGIVQLATFD